MGFGLVSDEGMKLTFISGNYKALAQREKNRSNDVQWNLLLGILHRYEHVCTRTSNCILPGTVCHFKTVPENGWI